MMIMHRRSSLLMGKLIAATLMVSVCPCRTATAGPASKKTDFLLKPEVSYQAEGVRDPFKSYLPDAPVVVSGKIEPKTDTPLPKLEVSGIFWGANFPQAIINGIIVKAGDSIGDVKITSIEPEGVTIKFNRRDYVLEAPAARNLETAKGKKEAPHEKSRR